MMAIDPRQLVGIDYAAVGSCWGLVREALPELPVDPADAMARRDELFQVLGDGEQAQAGDLIFMHLDGAAHVGVCIDHYRFVHAVRGKLSEIGSIGWFRLHEPHCRIARLRRGGAGARQAGSIERPRTPRTVRLVRLSGMVGGSVVSVEPITFAGPEAVSVAAVLRGQGANNLAEWLVLRNGAVVSDLRQEIADGDEIHVAPRPAEITTGTIILIAIALASAAASAFLVAGIKARAAGSGEAESRRYGFSRISSDAIAGDPLPVVLGSRVRYGGKVISVLPGEGADGNNRLRMLIDLSYGPVSKIGSFTADADGVDVADPRCAGIYLNDTTIDRFPGGKVSVRMGTDGQAVIPGFGDTEALREVGVGGAVMANTSGADRTSATPSGEAVLYTTLDPVDSAVLRIRFPRGLSSVTGSGQTSTRRVQHRHRRRTTDVGAGAGTWSAWETVTVERAESSEFFSSTRINGLGLVRMDFQVERITKEPTSVADVDEMRFDSVNEIRLAQNTYAGRAVIALDLAAGEQLSSVPRVSLAIDGYADCRIWDGLSPPTAPVFTRGYSRNPMALALEYMTNTRWGMGLPLAAADMSTMLELWARGDAALPRASGGTRPRYACDLVLAETKDAIDWLRIICDTAQAIPVPVGDQWRFIEDGPRDYPVEIFTEATIACSDDGASTFTLSRELTTGGVSTANRLSAQVENRLRDGRADVVSWPAYGASWLGAPLNEPVREETIRFDGITDPDQALAKLKQRLRRGRFVERTCAFTTTKPVVVVQPGDRFDVAVNLPGWGLGSGRIQAGSVDGAVVLDAAVTIGVGPHVLKIVHYDGTVETAAVLAQPGTYAAGTAIAIGGMAQPPAEGEEWAVGGQGIETKPFLCTKVAAEDAGQFRWRVEGAEYVPAVYVEDAETPNLPDVSTLPGAFQAPGPVLFPVAQDRLIGAAGAQTRRIVVSWGQTPADARNTAQFWIWYRLTGTTTWVRYSAPTITRRSQVLDISDVDVAYQFKVVAVSPGGSALSPYDDRVPIAGLAVGLGVPPPAPPSGLTLSLEAGGASYKAAWTAVDGAVGYQVLYGGATTGLPNAGAEDCLVLARTVAPELGGLRLPAGQATRLFVRSVNAAGRLSWTAATVNVSSAAVPPGLAIRGSARTFALSSEGTRTNLTWDSGQSRLELTSPASDGVYLSPEEDLTSATLSTISVKLGTANDAADPQIQDVAFALPSIEADQWGIVSTGPTTVGLLMPPYPDDRQSWVLEVRTFDGVIWSDWARIEPVLAGLGPRTVSKYQVRVTMRRAVAPYRPALRGVTVVVTD